MIKVEKDLRKVPASLNSDLTRQRRDEIIAAGEYPSSKKLKINPAFKATSSSAYDSRYKCEDIKEQLGKYIYNYKCAFCEQEVETFHVEHYRPKSIYYWLAYSWDNLLYCCPTCNINKLDKFKVEARVDIHQIPMNDIHNLGKLYDEVEHPFLVNPENEDIYEFLIFSKNGYISSKEERVNHTIKILKIDRDRLNDKRLFVYNEFVAKIKSRLDEYNLGDLDAKVKIKGLVEDFITDSENPIKEFLSFRRYIIKHWLKDLIKDLSS